MNSSGVPPSRPALRNPNRPQNIPLIIHLLRTMATYTDINYHLVFATKNRLRALHRDRRDDLYRFIRGVLKKRKSHLYRIGGVEDHLRILASLHPTVALADLVKEIKTASSAWIKGQKISPGLTIGRKDTGRSPSMRGHGPG